MNNIVLSFILTTIAGLSTLLGLIIIYIKFKEKDKIICGSLSFAAGVMICVSITDLIPESIKMLRYDNQRIKIILICLFFIVLGIIFSTIIDMLFVPKKNGLYKVGIISMIAIIIHNIPEGIATFITTTKNTTLGISLTIAIALHNIPEGISISVPIYYSTHSKWKAFLYTFISAISEPFGALITYLFLKNFINNQVLGCLFAFIAGIMLQISFCELIPTAKKYNFKSVYYYSLIIGITFMLLKFLL